MPKNTGMGGNKRKKGKKQVQEDRELRMKDESEEYAQIVKILGDGRFQCKCADGIERIAHVRGKMRKRIWLANGDIILVSLREFENEKCDVVEKYKEKEVAKLKNAGEIPDSFVLPSGSEEGEKGTGDGDILFEEQEVVTEKKKEGSTGFEIDSESEEEKEIEEEDKKDEDKNEDKKEEKVEEAKEKEKEKQEEMAKDNQKKSKRDKKDKDKKRKNNRDKKRGDKGDDDGGFNIDDI